MFEYNDIKIPEGHIGISPSQISKFFNYPSIWYKEAILGEEQEFKGNTATELGTVIHGIAEAVAKGENVTDDDIRAYLDTIDNEDVDKEYILNTYKGMATALINEYVLLNVPNLTEYGTQMNIGPQVTLKGTLDGYYDNETGIVLDYKTTKTKPQLKGFPWHYKIQLMAYAKMLKNDGYTPEQLRIVWVVQPTKTLPARVFVENYMITNDDWKELDDTLQLMVDSINLVREKPELAYIVFKSMQLKQ